jgi:hypothetical protein
MRGASHLGDRAAALVDGELDHDARDHTLAHLTRCDSCRAEIDALRQLKARVCALPGPGPSIELIQRLLAVGAASGAGPGPGWPDDRADRPDEPDEPDEPVLPTRVPVRDRLAVPGRAAVLGHAVLRANAALLRGRPAAARRAGVVAQAGVRVASGRPGAGPGGSRRPVVIRPRQRARLAAIGCFSIMIVVMGTAFTMGPSVSRPVLTPVLTPAVDRAGGTADYASAVGDVPEARDLAAPEVARTVREARGDVQRPGVPADIAPIAGASSAAKVATAVYVDDVGPDARGSAFGIAYLGAAGE